MPDIEAYLQREGNEFKDLFSSIGNENTSAIEAFTGSAPLINSIRLNIKIVEPTVDSVMASISIGKDYSALTSLITEFFVTVVLGSEKSVKLKAKAKNATVLLTGILGLAPVVGIPASLTNLLITIKDMFTTTALGNAQTRADQLDKLSNATSLW